MHSDISAARPPLTQLSDEELMFRDAVASFAQEEVRPRVKQMEDAGLALLAELKGLLDGAREDAQLVMRRLTETEALSDGALAAVREAMQGPRIILTP